ncbi:ArpU family phage packaging/lysis transcriptional regulator [Lysinibacillus pakistanensis]|uniref:ArpU family transcriptional regulator n=1 Tax=Lysinibacillus pakistanensis TaxID=759811 RepID=A0ABX6DCJ9_9BACI|nr:ArpU family transcriptional regulator [Lysinibacillus pakistanensis]
MKEIVPKVDEKKTKAALEKTLYKYRDYLLTLPSDLMPTITPAYSLVCPSNTNSFSSKTENLAIERVQYEEARTAYMNKIHSAVATLKPVERQIIIQRFLAEDPYYDVDIFIDLGLSKNTYYKKKWQAMLRLAFALKIEVYQRNAVVK